MKLNPKIAALLSGMHCALIVGCGGGGSTQTESPTPTPVPVVVAPIITTQPVTQTVDEGKTVTFSVTVSGDAPLHYQWQRNGVDVAGAAQAQYSFLAQFADSGSVWKVKVSNGSSTFAVSQEVTLTVVPRGIALLAGDLTYQPLSEYQDGQGAAARFYAPTGLAADSNGTVYVADINSVRKVTAGGAVTTLAGVHGLTGTTDGEGAAARFGFLGGITLGMDGDLYVVEELFRSEGTVPTAETKIGAIRRINPQGAVKTLATWTFGDISKDPFYGHFGRNPVVDRAGNVYVLVTSSADFFTATWRVLKISQAGVVTTFGLSEIGSSGFAQGDLQGQVRTALVLDAQSNLYVSLSGAYWCTQTAFNSLGVVIASPLLKSCMRGLTTNSNGALFAAVTLTDDARQRSGFGLAKLSELGELAVFAGSLDDQTPGGYLPTVGDLPGHLGWVRAIAADAMGFMYTLSDKAILRIQVP